MQKTECLAQKRVFVTEQTKTLSKDSVQYDFPRQRQKWWLVLYWTAWFLVYVRESHSLTSFPQHKTTGKTGTRQDLVWPEWALKQVREPFCWAWLCGSRRGALGSSGCSCGCCSSCWGCSLGLTQLSWAPLHNAASLFLLWLLAPTQKRLSSEEQGKGCQWQRGAGCARLTQKLAHILLQAHERMATLPLLDLAYSWNHTLTMIRVVQN